MAQGIQLEREKFCCSVCSKLLSEPVTIPCGHSYCLHCISEHFDGEDHTNIHSCPRCKELFIQRPTLVKNSMLAFVVAELKKAEALAARPPYAGPQDVACDICTGRKLKAVRSCLECFISYCDDHLQPHLSVPALMSHKLLEVSDLSEDSMRASLMEELTSVPPAPPTQPPFAGPGDTACDICTGRKLKAAKSCLQCLVSYCEEHLQPHLSVLPLKKHMLVEVFNNVRERVVPVAKAEPNSTPASPGYAASGDVACDICTGRKLKAAKSCLQCLVSYCEEHLQPHRSVPILQTHKLVDVFADLHQNICSCHQEVMKLFCRTDECCICYLCSKDAHKGHNKVSAAAERAEKQKELLQTRRAIQQRIKEKQRDVSLFKEEEDSVNRSANLALKNTEKMFTEHIRALEKRLADMTEKIKARQTTEVTRFRKVWEKLEQETDELRKKDAELEKLSLVEDATYFLLNYPSSGSLTKETPTVKLRRVQNFEKVAASVSEAGNKLEEVLCEECAKMSMSVTEVSPPSPSAEPVTRADFLQYACQITLNPNTANPHLSLSGGNREVVFTSVEQEYPNHPDRFAYSWQVLSAETLSGRCYLEVERSGKGVLVAVAYGSISRTGALNDTLFGQNNKSWALDCFKNSYEFIHNKLRSAVLGAWSPRVGVYLDYNAGVLSFYAIADTMILLRKVHTKFTQPLHVGLWVSEGAVAKVCKLK